MLTSVLRVYDTCNMTLRRTIAKAIAHNLLVTLVLAAFLMFGLATQDDPSTSRPAVENSARGLIEAHACDDPDSPTHAVITIDGTTRYVGQRLTDKAIEQTAFGIDHGMTVHGFCR